MPKAEAKKLKRRKSTKHIRCFKRLICFVCLMMAVVLILFLGANSYVKGAGKSFVVSKEKASAQKADCILVLGCAVNGITPSLMLKDRLDTAIELYKSGLTKKIIMSGDHRRDDYNEVGVMKAYAVTNGVQSSDIFMDHSGNSTYDSVYSLKNVFGCKSVIVVTQEYHLYRTLFLTNFYGIESYGIDAGGNNYGGQIIRDLREIAARDKELFYAYFVPLKKYDGSVIDISSDGDITNDKSYNRILSLMSE